MDEEFRPYEPVTVREEDVVTIDLPESISKKWITKKRIEGAVQGGPGNIRHDPSDRAANLNSDQYTGLACLAGFSLYVTGGMEFFMCSRLIQEIDPWSSDKGEDVPGLGIDVKGQKVHDGHNGYKDLVWGQATSYPLPVRPREMHAGNTYIAALYIPQGALENLEACVKLIGSATYYEMRCEPKRSIGRFDEPREGDTRGAWLRHTSNLQSLWPLEEVRPYWEKANALFADWRPRIMPYWEKSQEIQKQKRSRIRQAELDWMAEKAGLLRRLILEDMLRSECVVVAFSREENQAAKDFLVENRLLVIERPR